MWLLLGSTACANAPANDSRIGSRRYRAFDKGEYGIDIGDGRQPNSRVGG
jgi:hypothetical protein